MPIQSYRDLKVWQKAVDLAVESYRLSRKLPRSEVYGLASQIQRAAASIPANIAEGHGREHRGDYLHHLAIASGSLLELETHLLIAVRLTCIGADDLKPRSPALGGSGTNAEWIGLKPSKDDKSFSSLTPDT